MKKNQSSALKVAPLAAALLAFFMTSARADLEDEITKSFKVHPGEQLVVELDRGSIEIKTADEETVEIKVARKVGGSRSKAQKTLEAHIVTTTQTGGRVEVRAKYAGNKASGWFGRSPDIQVQCVVTVPRTFDVDLKTAGGSINVSELTGKVQANTSGGSLRFYKIEGPVTARTSGGSITVESAKGQVDVKTSGGSLTLSNIEGDVDAQTSGGSIRAQKLNGKAVVKTSGGGIQIADIPGPIEARTSGGSINANLRGQPAGDCTFMTSGGSVVVNLGDSVAVDVDAHTSAGRVSTDFPIVSVIQGEQKKNELRGKINGGGPLITAHTSGGSVRLQKN
ncbi:MAG: DUF4097 family beta strand repeat protein [Verrucomicrobia bacterium]|nr:DUF4097 family beta strand repeat protein [Verrucomicrobiota bacterium]